MLCELPLCHSCPEKLVRSCHRSHHCHEEIFWLQTKWHRLTQLLDYPLHHWISCYSKVYNSVSAMIKNKEYIIRGEVDGRNSKEVDCSRYIQVVSQKWQPVPPWNKRQHAGKSDHIETPRRHKQEGYRGLSEGSLWHSCRQDNTISCTKQVYVSSLMTRWTRLFGWTRS